MTHRLVICEQGERWTDRTIIADGRLRSDGSVEWTKLTEAGRREVEKLVTLWRSDQTEEARG